MLNRESVLPVGSVVQLAGDADHIFMITGFYPIAEDVLYDYTAVQYPLGNATAETAILFTADKIDKVLHEGYKNAAFPILLDALEASTGKMNAEIEAGNLRSAE